MPQLTVKRPIAQLTWLLSVVYFSCYLTRLNYATVLAEIITSEGLVKSDAALVTTAGFITYGIGQPVSGWLGDKFSPRMIIFGGLATTGAMNLLLPVCAGLGQMTAVWGVNGLAQAMIWPPMVRLMSIYFDKHAFERCCVTTSVGSGIATVLLYLLSPGIIARWGWRTVFLLCAAVTLLTSAAWLVLMGRFEARHGAAPCGTGPHGTLVDGTTPTLRQLVSLRGLVLISLAIIAQGILRDGVTTWVPTYLVEVFRLETGSSILTSVVIPVFSISAAWLTVVLNRRFFNHELHCSLALFLAGALSAAGMVVLFSGSALFSVLLAALLIACMHGINLMLVCDLPARFAKTGRVALISGILNAATYLGSALSTYGIALLAEHSGWRFTVLCWCAIALVGAVCCLLGSKSSARLFAQNPLESKAQK